MRTTLLFLCLAAIALSCGPSDPNPSRQAPDGQALFRQHCVTCHGADGTLGLMGAKDLSHSALSLNERILQITNGKGNMTAFKSILDEAAIRAVAEYSLSLKKQ